MARTRGVCRSWHSIGVSVEVAGIGVAKHGGMVTVDAGHADRPLVIE